MGTEVEGSLTPVRRRSLPDAVFEQLRNQIVSGGFKPGASLPAERILCERLGVNRGAVREALKRLEQVRLVSIQHGGATRVLDYQQCASMDLLRELITTPDGRPDAHVIRSVMEMRSAVVPDIARLAALRGGGVLADELDDLVGRMARAQAQLPVLQELALEFWNVMVEGSANIAYRLAYNSLRQTYREFMPLLTEVLQSEFADVAQHAAMAAAVRRGDAVTAESVARDVVRRGERHMSELFSALESGGASS
jgi:DNA-binding FadR family transcriptional regulator